MKPRERNGVRLGQPVRDLDGTSLGRVKRLLDWGFESRRTFTRRPFIVRYDEVRAVRDGALVVARSRQDLFELAAGRLPEGWQTQVPATGPAAPLSDEELRVFVDTRGQSVAPPPGEQPHAHPR